MFSLSEKVFAWLLLAVSAVQAQVSRGFLAVGTVFGGGDREGSL